MQRRPRVIKSSQLILRQVEVSPTFSHPEVTIDLDHYHLMATVFKVLQALSLCSLSLKKASSFTQILPGTMSILEPSPSSSSWLPFMLMLTPLRVTDLFTYLHLYCRPLFFLTWRGKVLPIRSLPSTPASMPLAAISQWQT